MKPILFVKYKDEYLVVDKIDSRFMNVCARDIGSDNQRDYWLNWEVITGEDFIEPTYYVYLKKNGTFREFGGCKETFDGFDTTCRGEINGVFFSSFTHFFLNTEEESK